MAVAVRIKLHPTGYCYENRALIPSAFQPKPNLVETTKACVPVVTPYFDSSCCAKFISFHGTHSFQKEGTFPFRNRLNHF
jgi:hypothetical protein